MALADLIAKLRNAQALIVDKGPAFLERVAEVATQVAEIANEAAEYLKQFDKVGAGPVSPFPGNLTRDEYDVQLEELKTLTADLQRFGTKPASALNIRLQTMKDDDKPALPSPVQLSFAKILWRVADDLQEKCSRVRPKS